MKRICLCVCAAGLGLMAGCSTTKSVAKLSGQGVSQDFNISYDPVWAAALGVAIMDDLDVVSSDRVRGRIVARRPMGESTFGDNVAIWVRPISEDRTQVEVVSRRVGPPLPFAKNQERFILKKIRETLLD